MVSTNKKLFAGQVPANKSYLLEEFWQLTYIPFGSERIKISLCLSYGESENKCL